MDSVLLLMHDKDIVVYPKESAWFARYVHHRQIEVGNKKELENPEALEIMAKSGNEYMQNLLELKHKKCGWISSGREVLVPRKLLKKDDLDIGLDKLEDEGRLYFYRSPSVHDRIYDSEVVEILRPFIDCDSNE